jgi:hypothetical protein
MAGNGNGYKQAVSWDSHCHEGKAVRLMRRLSTDDDDVVLVSFLG